VDTTGQSWPSQGAIVPACDTGRQERALPVTAGEGGALAHACPTIRATDNPASGITVRVTPALAFAIAAFVVSAIGLAVSIGKYWGQTEINHTQAAPDESLEEVRHRLPLRYQQLQVDQGDSPPRQESSEW